MVVTEWAAVIDPGWTVYVEDRRGLLARRVRAWQSLECPQPTSVGLTSATSLELRGSDGKAYAVRFDPRLLRPTPFHSLSPGDC